MRDEAFEVGAMAQVGPRRSVEIQLGAHVRGDSPTDDHATERGEDEHTYAVPDHVAT
jgi:hypothetical protein